MIKTAHKILCAAGSHRYGQRKLVDELPLPSPRSTKYMEERYLRLVMGQQTVATCIYCGKQDFEPLISDPQNPPRPTLMQIIKKILAVRSRL